MTCIRNEGITSFSPFFTIIFTFLKKSLTPEKLILPNSDVDSNFLRSISNIKNFISISETLESQSDLLVFENF